MPACNANGAGMFILCAMRSPYRRRTRRETTPMLLISTPECRPCLGRTASIRMSSSTTCIPRWVVGVPESVCCAGLVFPDPVLLQQHIACLFFRACVCRGRIPLRCCLVHLPPIPNPQVVQRCRLQPGSQGYPQTQDCAVLQSRGVHFSDAGKHFTAIMSAAAILPHLVPDMP